MVIKTNGTQFFSVPNNGIGKIFIRMLRQNLNKKKYSCRVRNRGPHKQYQLDTKAEDTKWFAVYIDKK